MPNPADRLPQHYSLAPAPTRCDSPLPAFGGSSRDVFRQSYNRTNFLFEHDLCEERSFSMSTLRELARRHPTSPAHAYWSNGEVDVADGWNAENHRYCLADTVAGIETNDSLAMLKHVEQDRVIGPRVREILQVIVELIGPRMSDDVTAARGTLLIASPRRTTAYHIDSDVNFLFQISGDKLFSVFDQSVTGVEELEKYFRGDPSAAVFKPASQGSAACYELRAGRGVHVPCMAAHWAQTLDAPSIALSLNFDLRSVTALGRLYRLNGRMREHGVRPCTPGVSKWRDRWKTTLLDGLDATRHLTARLESVLNSGRPAH